MPTKTDRILSYLPGTFQALPRPTALYSLVNAFGVELLHGENSLAAVMQAHWVDHADRFSEDIVDLAKIAALYGLTPRPDESVEEFREHLKRYIRIFLEGTVTVQGILRITAQALGVSIADDYADMDTWWTRNTDSLITSMARGDDAVEMLFGTRNKMAFGNPAQTAFVIGSIDLSSGVDLNSSNKLKLKVNKLAPIEINLIAGINEPDKINLDSLITSINNISNEKLGFDIAKAQNNRLFLSSPTTGANSQLELQAVDADATSSILGILPRVFNGTTATSATVTGLSNLENGIDLSNEHFLRLIIDNTQLAEIDCAGPIPENTTLDQVRDAINNAFDFELASHDGQYITLLSSGSGFSSSIGFQQAAAQDAKNQLFGAVNSVHTGKDAQAARIESSRDLRLGVDLSKQFNIRVIMDGLNAVTINCAGADSANTQLPEIVLAINSALGREGDVASQNGRYISLQSSVVGINSQIEFRVPNNDATEIIFGIGPRKFKGQNAKAARFDGEQINLDENGHLDISARRFLKLAIDGGSAQIINLAQQLMNQNLDPRKADLVTVANAINQAVNATIATQANGHLQLTSPSTGAASQLSVSPIEEVIERQFVTRAVITDEASQAIFGFVEKQATGTAATAARLIGTRDLSHGVDLRDSAYISLSLDNQTPVDINCAGKRPRATLLAEIVANINQQLASGVASDDGKHLLLTSQLTGSDSHITFATPRSNDALDTVMGIAPGTFRGSAASRVNFVGIINVAQSIDLSTASHIKLVTDGDAVEIDCAGNNPESTLASEIVNNINLALISQDLKPIASFDGAHILLTSNSSGQQSRIDFETATTGADATMLIFGINPPRQYQGQEAKPAKITGITELDTPSNLEQARFLNLSINGQTAVIVDCAAQAEDAKTVGLGDIITAINDSFDQPVASTQDGIHLVLTSPSSGINSQISVDAHSSSDARTLLFGDDVLEDTQGSLFQPATITGEIDLLSPADLSERRNIRLVVNNSAPLDIDVGGVAPATTFLDEIIQAINSVIPGLASGTDEDKLRLTAPISESDSHLTLLPLRHLEMIEYPPGFKASPVKRVQHGDSWSINNSGVTETIANIQLVPTQGSFGSQLVNLTHGSYLRILTELSSNETLNIGLNSQGYLDAELYLNDGTTRKLSPKELSVGLISQQALLPTENEWFLRLDKDGNKILQLNNPLANNTVVLRGKTAVQHDISVTVRESDLSENLLPLETSVYFIGRMQQLQGDFSLLDSNDNLIAELQVTSDIDLSTFVDKVVKVTGSFFVDTTPVLRVSKLVVLFDLVLSSLSDDSDLIQEEYKNITIGEGDNRDDSLVKIITTQSELIFANEFNSASFLTLPQGKSDWLYMECISSRFDKALFDVNNFAGGLCHEQGVFNASRFANAPPENSVAVFATSKPGKGHAVDVKFTWSEHQAGAFTVNLPDDLPKRFGGRFNESRFSHSNESAELYPNTVTEPKDDDMFLVSLIENGNTDAGLAASLLVNAEVVDFVPLGWAAVSIPLRKPSFLTLGTASAPAKIYLTEEGLDGFIEIRAREAGPWGNEIAITSRLCGPAIYEFAVHFQSARFENARQTVLGRPLAVLTNESLKPGPVGILQAKATGIQADVSRDRTGNPC